MQRSETTEGNYLIGMKNDITRINVDAHFVRSLGAKVNKNICRVKVRYRCLGYEIAYFSGTSSSQI